MKRVLGILILSVFVISLIGSVSPDFKAQVIKLTGDHKYASTLLPAPAPLEMNKNLAGKSNSEKFTDSDNSYNIQSKDVVLVE